MLKQLKGAFCGIGITYYCYLTSCRGVSSMELQPQLGLRPNRRLGISTGDIADTGAFGISSTRLLSKYFHKVSVRSFPEGDVFVV